MSLKFPVHNFPVDVSRLKEQGDDLICVLGPTASGKTRFAVELAVRLGSLEDSNAGSVGDNGNNRREAPPKSSLENQAGEGAGGGGMMEGRKFRFRPGAEIISADSRQVYTGMDIGTGKDREEYTVDLRKFREVLQPGKMFEKREGRLEDETAVPASFFDGRQERNAGEVVGTMIKIPCHLIDVVPAGTKYNLFEYRRDFLKVYNEIKSRGRMPVLCGGSGLYIEAATRDYQLQEVAPDPELRGVLEEKTMEELTAMLVRLKAARGDKPHNTTDFDTKKRVIRAIEIELAAAKGTVQFHSGRREGPDKSSLSFSPLKCKYIGIKVDRETRNRRIDARLKQRLENGMVEEVRGLLDKGIPAEDLIYYGLEYKFITRYLLGEMGYEEMAGKLGVAIHQFAKRQMTWFRGMERKGIEIEWVDWGTSPSNFV